MAALRIVQVADLLQRAREDRDAVRSPVIPSGPGTASPWLLRRSAPLLGRLYSSAMWGNLRAAQVLNRLGDHRAALHHFSAAAARDDKTRRGSWEFARCLLRLRANGCESPSVEYPSGRLCAALQTAAESVDPVIGLNAAIGLARVLFENGKYVDSIAAAERALSISAADPRALRAKANALIAGGNIRDARQIYGDIVAAEPGSSEARTKLRALETLPDIVRPGSPTDSESTGRILVGVGGGIGDMLHTTPLIRSIAKQTRKEVDVVVLADNPGAEFLMRNTRFAGRVFPICPDVLDRSYETVFLCHSFGELRFPFRAGRIVCSRDWRAFRPGGLPETVFNLEAAKALLGIPYEESDSAGYFVGDLEWQSPAETLIGIHAGSKAGRWLSKRWPHFSELSARLGARGIRVASFGTKDEYIAGTEDRTGGSIEEMCRSMLDCTHFVSNDSGAMHIANALGIPVLAVFAPTDPLTHMPLRDTTTGLALLKACAPCEVKNHRYFASGACRCVAEVGVEAIERKIFEMPGVEGKRDAAYGLVFTASNAKRHA